MSERISLRALKKRGTPPGEIYRGGLVSMNLAERDALVEAVEAAHEARLNVYVGDRLGQALERFDFEERP